MRSFKIQINIGVFLTKHQKQAQFSISNNLRNVGESSFTLRGTPPRFDLWIQIYVVIYRLSFVPNDL